MHMRAHCAGGIGQTGRKSTCNEAGFTFPPGELMRREQPDLIVDRPEELLDLL
jgi:hypothetical protein